MKSVEMKNIIIGTAGHIDHGKTALVRALTGIDTDRLKEEKQRGISIDLGFAHLKLSENLRLAFVDVPGHERFIKNMLAGVSGIDLVLFVIAADESIKPQTREHFDICLLLGIRKGIIVLTKADLAEGDLIELVRLEADEFVRGSFLEDRPWSPSAPRPARGSTNCAPSSQNWPRPFAKKTPPNIFACRSTALSPCAASEPWSPERWSQEPCAWSRKWICIRPPKRVRVRGIQVHGLRAWPANAGQRTALNFAGVETSELDAWHAAGGGWTISSHYAQSIALSNCCPPPSR